MGLGEVSGIKTSHKDSNNVVTHRPCYSREVYGVLFLMIGLSEHVCGAHHISKSADNRVRDGWIYR